MDTLFQWNHAHIVFAKFTDSVPTPLLIDLLVLDRTRSENVIPKDPGTMWHHTSNVAGGGEINLINKAFWGEFWPMDYYRQPPPPKCLFTATKKHTYNCCKAWDIWSLLVRKLYKEKKNDIIEDRFGTFNVVLLKDSRQVWSLLGAETII